MPKNKKSDMSITLIVAAVIALIIIVVIVAIFTKGSGKVANTLQGCKSRGGTCEDEDTKCIKKDAMEIYNVDCDKPKQVCCLKV